MVVGEGWRERREGGHTPLNESFSVVKELYMEVLCSYWVFFMLCAFLWLVF